MKRKIFNNLIAIISVVPLAGIYLVVYLLHNNTLNLDDKTHRTIVIIAVLLSLFYASIFMQLKSDWSF
jgi:hypothetical protein